MGESPLSRLISYTSDFRGSIYLASTFSILNKLFDLAPPVLIGAAVDIVVRREESVFGKFGIKDLTTQLVILALITFVIWFSESLFEYLFKLKWRNLAQNVEHKLRMDVYRHIQNLEMEFFEDEQSGRLMAILNDDVNQLERFLDIGANDLLQVGTTIIVILMTFLALSPVVGLIAIVPMPFIIIGSIRFQRLLEPRYADVREKVGVLNGRLANNLTGISTIKSYTAEEYEASRIEESSKEYMQANRSAILLSSAFSPLIRMVIVAGFIGMLIVGGSLTLNGSLEIAAYSVIVFLIQRLLWPLTRLGETFDQYQRAMASTTRALNLLDKSPKIVSGTKRISPESVEGRIDFENVCFSYKSRPDVLTKFSVSIHSGDTVAFVGATGAGKSTIVKLLLRFYDPQEGSVKLDGIDLKELNLTDLRRSIALVSQDTFILDGTVKDNILYGNHEASDEEIVNAAKIAEVHDFITTLPQKYDTLVGERGQKLSGGQRQRLSIARAILKNPPIMVFDEATSSVDNETEAAIQRSLERVTQEHTTIIIAHRLSTIRNADQIFVLDKGKIVERGKHEELLANDGIYSTLWRVQTGERLISE